MNENIADTMGLEASLGAYRIYEKEKKSKSSEVLPGLENLSTEQLFFLSYANVSINIYMYIYSFILITGTYVCHVCTAVFNI